MFNLFKKNKAVCHLAAPIDGHTMSLEEVKDPVFAQKMMGDGIAVRSSGDVVVAPADGEICLFPKTKHAIGLKLDNGVEVLIHIGLDSVDLKGEGFTQLAQVGDHVKMGTPLLKIDRAFAESKGVSLDTPMIIVNYTDYEILAYHHDMDVKAGETVVVEYR